MSCIGSVHFVSLFTNRIWCLSLPLEPIFLILNVFPLWLLFAEAHTMSKRIHSLILSQTAHQFSLVGLTPTGSTGSPMFQATVFPRAYLEMPGTEPTIFCGPNMCPTTNVQSQKYIPKYIGFCIKPGLNAIQLFWQSILKGGAKAEQTFTISFYRLTTSLTYNLRTMLSIHVFLRALTLKVLQILSRFLCRF